MNTLENFSELTRAVRGLIRIGVVSEIDTEQGLCRVETGELDTAFVLPAIYSDDFPAPSVSAHAYHVQFSDGAVLE